MSNILLLKSAPNRVTAPALAASQLSRAATVPLGDSRPVEHMPLATLDRISVAAIVVDARLRVNWASRPARLEFGPMFGSLATHSVLRLGRAEARDQLAHAVGSACAGEAAEVVLHVDTSDTPLLVRALPFDEANDGQALALLIVVDVAAGIKIEAGLIERRLSALFGLTPMEAKVACRLANGDGMGRVAAALGIAVSTARTHAARCYEKTGVRRQAALARLANRVRLA